MKLIPCLFIALLLAGCGAPRVVTDTQIVEVPVTVFCKVKDVEAPTEPELPFDTTARKDMPLAEKTKLLVAQNFVLKGYVSDLKGYAKELKGAVDGCKAPYNQIK